MPKKHTFEYVFDYFKEQNCKLLSTEYTGNKNKLEYMCSCGNKSSISFGNFKKGHRCSKCGNNEKFTFDYVSKFFKEQNCELLSTEYTNSITKLDYICTCGNIAKIGFSSFKAGNRCMKCGGSEKLTFEYISNYFEEQNCKLLSTEYINSRTKLKYMCKCGNNSTINFHSFKGGNRCMKCSGKEKFAFEYVFNYFKEQNCELISKEYINGKSKLDYICKCGNTSTINFHSFKNGNRCRKCAGNETHTFEYIFNYFKEQDCKLLSIEYINSYTKLNYICSCGDNYSTTFNSFQNGHRCRGCGIEKAMKNSYSYKKYIFPSGNTRDIQGYEHFALNELIKNFSENQILTDRKDMPVIKYTQNGKSYNYYPDIYIPHINKIIEVKSDWTLEKHYIKNMLKSLETKKKYIFEFWIFDGKGNKVIV